MNTDVENLYIDKHVRNLNTWTKPKYLLKE